MEEVVANIDDVCETFKQQQHQCSCEFTLKHGVIVEWLINEGNKVSRKKSSCTKNWKISIFFSKNKK